jgi:hypothetical protein
MFFVVCNDPVSQPFHWMYPGTYQPLQAVSLLLADLLQHPHSDHSSISRGLIDAVFELYQMDEGIVSRDEPPMRQLSPSGKEAWAMLVRTRRKALEQIGVDHHVLYPSVVSSDTCICSETIRQRPTNSGRSEQQWTSHTTPNDQQGLINQPEDINPEELGISPGILGSMNFDWRAFDEAVGSSGGIMP